MWMTYSKEYGKSYSPVDHEPTKYYDITFFLNELSALRDLQQHPGKLAIEIPTGLGAATMAYLEQENRKPTPAWRQSDNR